MDSEQENVWVTLNYQGKDYNVVVTLTEAEELLNDQQKSDQYVKMLLENSNASAEDGEATEDAASISALTPENSSQEKIWQSKGRPTQRDEEATVLLLQLHEKYRSKFDDKKTIKSQLWQQIAMDLDTAGYIVGEGKIGAERCRQKFSNLQKQYVGFIKHMRRTGEEKRESPPHFDAMHSILGGKDKVNPQGLQDTETDGDDDLHDEEKPTTSAEIQNRFSKLQNKKPKSTNILLLEEMKKQRCETLEERRREFAVFERHLERPNNQGDQLLHILNRMCEQSTNTRKRTRHNIDANEESELKN